MLYMFECEEMCVHMCEHVCRGQMLMSSVFYHHPPHLRQVFSLSPELIDSLRQAGQ